MINQFYHYLVVENAPDVCEGIIRRMKPFDKWQSVGFCVSLSEAIEKIGLTQPELLFLDWSINGGSAFEVMNFIKSIPNYNPYIIFNTGFQKDNPEIPQELFNNYKVDKYLIKPFWENLRLNLSAYLTEAEAKTVAHIKANKFAWIEDSNGKNIGVQLSKLICICQHPIEPRKRIFYFQEEKKEVVVPIQWQKCVELLTKNEIDFFITKARSHIVCRNFIDSYEKPNVRLKYFPARVEVVKENQKNFEKWLGI